MGDLDDLGSKIEILFPQNLPFCLCLNVSGKEEPDLPIRDLKDQGIIVYIREISPGGTSDELRGGVKHLCLQRSRQLGPVPRL